MPFLSKPRTSREWFAIAVRLAMACRASGYKRSAAFWREMAWRAFFGRVPVG
jgi:hypothetical protein